MRVNDPGVPLPRDCTELTSGTNIPFTAQCQAISGESFVLGTSDEGRTGRGDNQSAISEIAQASRQEQYLTLAAPPAAPGVNVENSGQIHYASSCRAKALNSPRSHGSGESVISSGCHCTAITHQSSSVDSSPSIIPSGDRAVTRRPSATRFTD